MKTHISVLAATLLFTVSACEIDDYLNTTPKTNLTEGDFYTTEEQLAAAVNDIYRQMGRLYDAYSIPSLYGELFSDNGEVAGQLGGNAVDAPIDRHIINTANTRIENAWDVAYNAIYVVNNALHYVNSTSLDIDATRINRWIAECMVVRSLAYFNLTRAFGAVPFVTEKITPAEAYDYLREDPDLIMNSLLDDLAFAKEHLPPAYSGSDIGRVTRYSAAAVRAKIFLNLGDTEAARQELAFIIESGQFSLDSNGDGVPNADDYAYLFAPDTKNCPSSVLEAQYHSGVNAPNSNHLQSFAPHLDNFDHPLIDRDIRRGGGINIPTSDLAAEYEAGDPRKELTFLPGYNDASTGAFVEYPFTIKYFDPDWDNPGQNFEIIRYADILLMYAEVTGDPQYLNMVRSRVGLPAYGSNGYPSDQYPTLELAIEHERRMELAMEMHRMFDLIRTGRAAEVLRDKTEGFREDRILFPIPQRAIDTNPDLTQNTGY